MCSQRGASEEPAREPARSQRGASEEPARSQRGASEEPARSQRGASEEPARSQRGASEEPARSQRGASEEPARSQRGASEEPAKNGILEERGLRAILVLAKWTCEKHCEQCCYEPHWPWIFCIFAGGLGFLVLGSAETNSGTCCNFWVFLGLSWVSPGSLLDLSWISPETSLGPSCFFWGLL